MLVPTFKKLICKTSVCVSSHILRIIVKPVFALVPAFKELS
ncbi:hypothetical protein LEP1GSC035_0896 [Leptospira noguchii str. 2007001578]|uniref:SLEI domain protein, PF07620 family n=1 Tax=Leptospira noguchii str. 2007001578 TaxID=1049974 RepID=A0ABN0IYN2_9LEPT|nr:hypothetical protein LEP1GSC035_0896 [Leptospira noguchii str. 2007001578]